MKFAKCLLTLMVIFLQPAAAEQSVTQGHFELHFNTFPSTFLDQKVATTHQIKRSSSRGIVSITVMDTESSPAKAVEAEVVIVAKNLLGQSKTVGIKTIKDNSGGIYYLGLFKMNNQENVNFIIQAKPNESKQTISHKFTREFFTQ